ncbi:glycosyltransferase family 2 protein [bacterium]|nr:glycosyltransferase family 2 protein [bacterium]
MKLIIQIPCYNEEQTLPVTLRALPRRLRGVDRIEVVVIDDGSSDGTVRAARDGKAAHVVRFKNHRGLADAFSAGLDACVRLGADIIVNTDADNQYAAADIQSLIDPILSGEADMVIGDRRVETIRHFSFIKKRLQKWGSWTVRQLSGTDIPDVTSGFRAMSREAAMRLNILSRFTYTLETVIQAGKKNMAVTHVPVRTNAQTRPSRLFSNIGSYLKRSVTTMIRIYALYEPLKIFLSIGGAVFGLGFLLGLRFLWFYFTGSGTGHIQSLILAAVLMIVGFQVAMIGLLSDLIAANRRLIEDVLYRMKKLEFGDGERKKRPRA